MKKNIFWGIIFILSAILLILNALGIRFGLPENISVWKIVLCIGLVMWIIDQCVKKHFANIFFPSNNSNKFCTKLFSSKSFSDDTSENN